MANNPNVNKVVYGNQWRFNRNSQTIIASLYNKQLFYKTEGTSDWVNVSAYKGNYSTIFNIYCGSIVGLIKTITTDAISCNGGTLNFRTTLYASTDTSTYTIKLVKDNFERVIFTKTFEDSDISTTESIIISTPINNEQIVIEISGRCLVFWVEFIPNI
jgi:hypothetical protein